MSRRYDSPRQEHDPNVRYWSIKIDMGDGEPVMDFGGTAFSEEQVREEVARWLRGFADNVEKTGSP